MILIILFNFLLAVIYILTKQLSFIASPAFFTGVRFLSAGLFFATLSMLNQKSKCSLKKLFFLHPAIFIIVGVSFGLADIVRTYALQYIPSSHASLLATIAPFIALIVSYFLASEPILQRKVFGVVIGLLGLTPLLSKKIMSCSTPSTFITCYLLFILSLILLIIGGTYSKKLSSYNYSLIDLLSIFMSIAGITGLSISYVTDTITQEFVASLYDHWHLILLCIVIQNICGFYLYNYLVKYHPVTLVTFSNLLVPLFTSAILGWYRLETVEYEFFFALGMLVIAFVVFMFPTSRLHLIRR